MGRLLIFMSGSTPDMNLRTRPWDVTMPWQECSHFKFIEKKAGQIMTPTLLLEDLRSADIRAHGGQGNVSQCRH